MFGRSGPKRLLIVVLVLGAAWLAYDRFGRPRDERSFKAVVLQVDTTSITAFHFLPAPRERGLPMDFARAGDQWTLTFNGRTVDVDPVRISELFADLHELRTLSVIGKWSAVKDRYDLSDSLADRLVIDLSQGPRTIAIGRLVVGNDEGTAVRLPNDELVYKVESKLGSWADLPPDHWLAKYLVTGDPNNWEQLRFTFPTDTGYTMVRSEEGWSIDGMPCDSAKLIPYLQSLSKAVGQTVLPIADTTGSVHAFRLEITDRSRTEPLVVTVRAKPDHFVVISSLNPSVAMPFDAQRELPRMFRPRGVFLKR